VKATVLALLTAFVVGLAHVEATTRLDRLPMVLLRLAAWRLPKPYRADQLEEWTANLRDEVYDPTPGLPLTRLVRGLIFAGSALLAARRLARTLDPSRPRTIVGTYLRSSWALGFRVATAAYEAGASRMIANALGYAVALHWLSFLVAGLAAVSRDVPVETSLATVFMPVWVGAMAVTGLARGAALTLQEVGRGRGWSIRKTYWARELPTDMLVLAVPFLTANDSPPIFALMWGGLMLPGLLWLTWRTSLRPEQIRWEAAMIRPLAR
jgi:hypothetical protein